MADKRIKKLCQKCAKYSHARPRERRCKRIEQRFAGRYYCYGRLVTVPTMPTEAELAKHNARTDYEGKLAKAHKQLDASITKVKRALTSVELWRGRVKHYEKQIANRDHPKPKTPKRPKKTRAIVLEGTDAEVRS